MPWTPPRHVASYFFERLEQPTNVGQDLGRCFVPRVLALIAPLMPPVSAPAIGTGNASRARSGSFYAVGDLSPATLRNLRVDRVEEGRPWRAKGRRR